MNEIKDSLKSKKIMIVCGESSGDLHGANLVLELFRLCPGCKIFGIGGRRMRREGFSAFFKSEDLSFMGITDVAYNLKVISEAKKMAQYAIKDLNPDILILIDYPGFNLRLAEFAKKNKTKVLYYISPKFWAWNSKRIEKIKKFTDHSALIFPFEKNIYDEFDIPSTFVGNPLLDYEIPEKKNRKFAEISAAPVIGMLPGSRKGELKRHLKIMLETAVLISREFEKVKFIVSFACSGEEDFFYSMLKKYTDIIDIEVEEGSVYRVFEKADFLVAASGTVTLEAAVAKIPMVIMYKVSSLTYFAGKLLIKTPFIGLASIIAGREVVPEFIQNDANPEKIKNAVVYYLREEDVYLKMINDLNEVRAMLGSNGVAKRVAKIALNMANA
ncbi:MAG: lipid-A-disaccharide synthase [Desulfobacteraceae bacterium]|nr:lipid-A-disaccharide synthase [Desulfobacteraceae bacterium]MCB9494840.1 lipid-A-disaccharide synthase [Desulfobacteraceae bacterium]